jgi:hypothetical protein
MNSVILEIENVDVILDKINQELSLFCKTDENKNILYSVIIKFEELNNVFNNVKNKMLEELSDIKINSNVNNLENQISVLTSHLKDADNEIESLESSLTTEKEVSSSRLKKLNTFSTEFEKCKNIINNLTNVIEEKNKQIQDLAYKNSKDGEKIKSESYISKLNDGNSKLIQYKNEKIKNLENDLAKYQNTQDLNIEKIKDLERLNIKTEKDKTELILMIQEFKKNHISLEDEIALKNYKSEIEVSILDENNNLQLRTNDNKKPLLKSDYTHFENTKMNKKTRVCCFL